MSMFGSGKDDRVIPVVNLKGVLVAGAGRPLSSGKNLNFDSVQDELTDAFNMAGAIAIALDINSPGGSPAQSELIGQHIRALAKEKNIPVFAFVQDVAASGGYWIACAADQIYAARTSMLGSIGVVNEGYGYEGLFKKLGLETRTFTAGKSKRRMDPTKPVSEEDQEWMDQNLAKMHDIFKDWIVERRGERLLVPEGQDKNAYLDDKIFTGDVWFGDEAKDLGLIDGVGYIDQVLVDKFGKDIEIVEIVPPREGLLSMLRSSFGAASSGVDTNSEKMGAAMIHAAVDELKTESIWTPYKMR